MNHNTEIDDNSINRSNLSISDRKTKHKSVLMTENDIAE